MNKNYLIWKIIDKKGGTEVFFSGKEIVGIDFKNVYIEAGTKTFPRMLESYEIKSHTFINVLGKEIKLEF